MKMLLVGAFERIDILLVFARCRVATTIAWVSPLVNSAGAMGARKHADFGAGSAALSSGRGRRCAGSCRATAQSDITGSIRALLEQLLDGFLVRFRGRSAPWREPWISEMRSCRTPFLRNLVGRPKFGFRKRLELVGERRLLTDGNGAGSFAARYRASGRCRRSRLHGASDRTSRAQHDLFGEFSCFPTPPSAPHPRFRRRRGRGRIRAFRPLAD